MTHFLIKIAGRYARIIFTTWAILFLFDLLLRRISEPPVNAFGNPIAFAMTVFITKTMMSLTRWPLVWRRTSESIRKFWCGIAGIEFFNLALNGLCLFFVAFAGRSTSPATDWSADFQFAPIDMVWIAILVYSFSVSATADHRVIMAKNALKPARRFLQLLAAYAWLIVVFILFFYSRLLGYAFAEASLVTFFLLSNSFLLGSLRRSTRMRGLTIGSVTILGLMVFSYAHERRKSTEPSVFLGLLGPQKSWTFSDLEKIDRPSVWIDWADVSLGKKTEPEKIDQALARLESICPPTPTDVTDTIECFEKGARPSRTVVSGLVDDRAVLSRLNSSSQYVQLLGVLSARRLDALSPETKNRLQDIGRQRGRQGLLAEVTLAAPRAAKRTEVRIVVHEEK